MVKHAWRYDSALAQVMRKLEGDASFDTVECQLHHKNKGYCSATINLALLELEMAKAKVEEGV